jgi:hypothetical protein
MKKVITLSVLVCLLFLLYTPTESQSVVIWTEKGCNATYSPGDAVKIHYEVFDSGWTTVSKVYPDLHEEEIATWKYFHRGGEYTETDVLGPECGTVTYVVRFWQEASPGYITCFPCNACGPSVVYVMEAGINTCSINVQCGMKTELSTDKPEYIHGVDSQVDITLTITDDHKMPLDADSVVMDVNGESIKPVKTLPGFYTASFDLSGRHHGEYTVTANVFKTNYPRLVEAVPVAFIRPVTVELSTDSLYAPGSQAVVRAEVRDATGNGVSELSFALSVSGVTVPFTSLGGGVYRTGMDLTGFAPGDYLADITNMEDHVRVEHVGTAAFRVGGLPEFTIEFEGHEKIKIGSPVNISAFLLNTGKGDALNVAVSVQSPPEIDIGDVAVYSPTVPQGGQTTALISVTGRQQGEYMVDVIISFEDAGGNAHTAEDSFPVTVTGDVTIFFVVGIIAAAAVVAGAYAVLRKTGKPAEPLGKEVKEVPEKK